ncbi:SDR family NAD(P)-dependent oxidoreductase [Blastococcus sp. URHD0036]|uniref:SDR family NAD(P)-dependent oxidoreductase n=1 Tax=Blastococcus sp. URHD0036 TaxID=1380356 RepID=UPI0012DEFBA9|nr:SDR family NAD(P)-dependent oxidoreductase [Blastococcus sp. URHD0036]
MLDYDVAAIVTGGASGLGEATVRALAARGTAVSILDLDEARGAALAAELGGATTFVRTDVTDEASVRAAVDEATSKGRPLRIAVSSAGIANVENIVGADGAAHGVDLWQRTLAVNLTGTFNVLRLASAAMAATEPGEDGARGVVLNVASIAAYDGAAGQLAYAASKGGVVAMTLPAARDLAAVGIRVCAIAPGLIETPIMGAAPSEMLQEWAAQVNPFPKRLGRAEEFAQLALAVVDNPYLNGEVIRLDGASRPS